MNANREHKWCIRHAEQLERVSARGRRRQSTHAVEKRRIASTESRHRQAIQSIDRQREAACASKLSTRHVPLKLETEKLPGEQRQRRKRAKPTSLRGQRKKRSRALPSQRSTIQPPSAPKHISHATCTLMMPCELAPGVKSRNECDSTQTTTMPRSRQRRTLSKNQIKA